MAEQITELAILDGDECARASAEIHVLRDRWIRRSPALPFFTLSAASYLDAPANPVFYRRLARHTNPMLWQHFEWLYERVSATLAAHLGAPVGFGDDTALPGFHVYLACKTFEKPIASIHCDAQFGSIDWSEGEAPDTTRPLSFTLPLRLPHRGGGMYLWDVHADEIRENRGASPATLAARGRRTVEYSCGRMVLHSGRYLHQAAPGRRLRGDDERFTLQGHAVRRGGRWELYW